MIIAWRLVKTRHLATAWDGEVGASREPALGTGVSYAEMTAGLLEHTVYHAGQLALLRKLVRSTADV